MADVAKSITYAIRFEDSQLSGIVTSDRGGRTRFGVAEKWHPWVAQIGFYDTMSKEQALGVALSILLHDYALPLRIVDIPDQAIADKLLSLGINDGITYPVRWLQEAVGSNPDGHMGPATIAAIDKSDKKKALDALKEQAVLWYTQVAKDDPSQEQYLNGWINRANA